MKTRRGMRSLIYRISDLQQETNRYVTFYASLSMMVVVIVMKSVFASTLPT
jgi:hypothetical protein